MKKIVLLAFVSVFLLSTMVVTSVTSQERTVGVNEGDWFEYAVNSTWFSNVPGAEPPLYWIMANDTEWFKITVQNISDTNITGQILIHYKNDTEKTSAIIVDVNTGQGNGTQMFISANLNQSDIIYTDPPPSPLSGATINETISRTCIGGIAEVNHLNLTETWTDTNGSYVQSLNWYWYKDTGALCEGGMYWYNKTGEYLTTFSYIYLIIGIIPEFSTLPSILLVLIVLTVAVAIIKRRLLKKPIH